MTDTATVAAHEAAHATTALILGLPILTVSVKPDATTNGRVAIRYADTYEDMRKRISVILSGIVESGDPPQWPLRTDRSTDEANLRQVADRLSLDAAGYNEAVRKALDRTTSTPYVRLHTAIAHALERDGVLDTQQIKTIAREASMEHVLLKATTVAADLGEFEAIISTATIDRERDIVDPSAMVAALHRWTPTGKKLPLAWNHSGAAEDQIGHINPESAMETLGEVSVTGWIDQSTERGADAWRLVKSGVLGFSFGYMITDSIKRADGVRLIRALDVFEVSATTTPMNGDTRVLSWKSAAIEDDPMIAALNRAYKAADEIHRKAIDRELPIAIAVFDA